MSTPYRILNAATALKEARLVDITKSNESLETVSPETVEIRLLSTRTSGSARVTRKESVNTVPTTKTTGAFLGRALPTASPMGSMPSLTPMRKKGEA